MDMMPRWLSLVERETCNLVVAGSIPVRGSFIHFQNLDFLLIYSNYRNIYILVKL